MRVLAMLLVAVLSLASMQPAMAQSDGEAVAWRLIRNSADPDVFRNYLSEYPNGQHAGDARSKLDALTDSGESMAPPPDAPAPKPPKQNSKPVAKPKPTKVEEKAPRSASVVGTWQILARCPNARPTIGSFNVTSATATGIEGVLTAQEGYPGVFYGGGVNGNSLTYYYKYVDGLGIEREMLWSATVADGGKTMAGTADGPTGPCSFKASKIR